MGTLSNTTAPYVLFAAPLSLYSGKARSYLRKAGLPFQERLPSHPDYMAKVFPKLDRFWLPVLLTPEGAVVQDTTEIIDYLEAAHPDRALAYPAGPRQSVVALLLELFGDEGLLRPAMHYRWNFPAANNEFLKSEFARGIAPQGPSAESEAMAAKAMDRMQSYLPTLGVTKATIPSIRDAHFDLLDALDAHLATMPYLLGGRPTIADFGLIGPLYAHLGRDPYPASLMKHRAQRVWRWVERMNAVDPDCPEFPDYPAELVPDDAIPETLFPVLALMARDYLPELKALSAATDAYLEAHPDVSTGHQVVPDGAPRALGAMSVALYGREMTIAARYYGLWLLQRAQSAYDHLDQADRQAVDTVLERARLSEVMGLRPARTIERVACREIWGSRRDRRR